MIIWVKKKSHTVHCIILILHVMLFAIFFVVSADNENYKNLLWEYAICETDETQTPLVI